MSHFDPAPDINCESCSGHGYILKPKKGFAHATICTCVATCPRCEGGVVRKQVDGVWRSGRCRCQKLPDRIDIFNRSGITARHGDKSISNFQWIDKSNHKIQTTTSIWVEKFAEGVEDKGIVFYGDVGRGKTHLMVGLCKLLIFDHGIPIRFIEFSRLLGQLRAGYSAGKSDEAVLGELVSVPILAIDEIGKGRLTEWEMSIIDDIISRRYNALKPLLGTTNYQWKGPSGTPVPALASQEFKQTLGDRIGGRAFSRLVEISIPMQLFGADYRTLNDQDVEVMVRQASESSKPPKPKRFR
jgi:DNA replication protein DnaC